MHHYYYYYYSHVYSDKHGLYMQQTSNYRLFCVNKYMGKETQTGAVVPFLRQIVEQLKG